MILKRFLLEVDSICLFLGGLAFVLLVGSASGQPALHPPSITGELRVQKNSNKTFLRTQGFALNTDLFWVTVSRPQGNNYTNQPTWSVGAVVDYYFNPHSGLYGGLCYSPRKVSGGALGQADAAYLDATLGGALSLSGKFLGLKSKTIFHLGIYQATPLSSSSQIQDLSLDQIYWGAHFDTRTLFEINTSTGLGYGVWIKLPFTPASSVSSLRIVEVGVGLTAQFL